MRGRYYTHIKHLRKGVHHCPPLQAAWNKYGEKAFEFSVLEHIEDVKQQISRSLIGHKVSDEGRDKIRIAASNPSNETRAKQRASHIGNSHTQESKNKISSALKGIPKYQFTLQRAQNFFSAEPNFTIT